MLALGVPCITLGTLAIEIQKFNRGHGHFVTWHGVANFFSRVSRSHSLTILSQIFGLVSIAWLVGQVMLGGGSVWFGGAAFGGGMKAKMIWKYHR
jgi:cytochrome b-561 domain containing protein 2